MKILAFLLYCTLNTYHAFTQTSKNSIGINPFVRYDIGKSFVGWETATEGQNFIKASGVSYGISINFRRQIQTGNYIYLGAGYYCQNISKLTTRNNRGIGDSRLINFPSPLFIFFYSDSYIYNTISANIGFEKSFELNNKYLLIAGIDITNLYAYSQSYHLTSNSTGTQKYNKNDFHYLGLLSSLDINILKSIGRISIGPKIKFPVFTHLKTDATFPNENDNNYRNQWFRGIGLGFSLIYNL